jgi:hypothetical protein
METRKKFSADELEKRNLLLMVLEEIDLSFSYFTAIKLYGTYGIISKKRRDYVVFISAGFAATLMSCRKLTEFFSKSSPKYPNDLRAEIFKFQSSNPSINQKNFHQISKYVAHFTKEGESLRMRGMNIGLLTEIVYRQCFEFFDFLETNFLTRNELCDRQILARMYLIRRKYKNFKRLPALNFLIAP